MEMSNKPPHTFGLFTFSPPEHLSADLAFQNKSVPSQNAGRIDSRLQMTSIVSCKISRLWPLNERQQPLCQTSLWKLRFLASLCRPCPAFERIIQLVVTTCNGCWKKKSHHIGFVNRLGFQNKYVPSQNAGRIDSRLQMTSIVSCKISRLWPLNKRQQPLCQTSLWKLRFLASLCRPCPAFERIIQLVVTMCNGCWKKKSHHIGFVSRLGFPKQISALTKCRKDWQ